METLQMNLKGRECLLRATLLRADREFKKLMKGRKYESVTLKDN
jgi:hypothetical protein